MDLIIAATRSFFKTRFAGAKARVKISAGRLENL